MDPLNNLYSDLSERIKPSPIRALVPFIRQPGVISFAGGLPAPETFPVEQIQAIMQNILEEEPESALQYGPTAGDPRLRHALAERLNDKKGFSISADQVMITAGSQQALFLAAMIHLNPGDKVAVESPTFTGGIAAFDPFQPEFVPLKMDANGLITQELEDYLTGGNRIKLLYTIPDFQNPTGVTLSLERRKHLIELANQFDFIIIEDAPYTDLRYSGEPVAAIYELDQSGRTYYCGSFSKIFSPIRLGWLVGPEPVIQRLNIAKQPVDTCSPMLTQAMVYYFLAQGLMDAQIQKVVDFYHGRRDVMLNILTETMPEGVTWTQPEGGMFVWITVPEHVDVQALFHKAIEKKVAFVTGSAFFVDGAVQANTLRVNFISETPENIRAGVVNLANALNELI
ncbi:MAG: PLP-dependent aminotransferase family protein [Chloroflexota bacterium]